MTPDAVLGELEGLRALARCLVHGDADADDLLQDTAVAVLQHPPADSGQGAVRGWLAVVLRNRWRMDRRSEARRRAREQAAVLAAGRDADLDPVARARTIERLASAVVALDEPFRTTVIRRYLDGKTCAQIARELGVPAGTVRWRLKTALGRLRTALDDSAPRWQRALVPLVGATVKTKTSTALVVLLIVLLGIIAAVWIARPGRSPEPAKPVIVASQPAVPRPAARSAEIEVAAIRDPRPGQARASVEPIDEASGIISGRVINWSTGDGVGGAELTFTADEGALTVRTRDDGAFDLAPGAPGHFLLSTVAAPGFLPYAPELLHSTVRVRLVRGRAVRGVTVFLFPALDYRGTVVDARARPVPNARVRLLGTPAGEQAIDKLQTEWTSDRDGRFTFHAADDAVLEATRGNARGWARLDDGVMITRELTIAIGDAAARDATIDGRATDASGAAIADVLVRAEPAGEINTRSNAFAVTGPDGAFTLTSLDRGAYNLAAQVDGHAPALIENVAGGTRGVALVLDAGLPLAGRVVDGNGAPAPSFILLVQRRRAAARELVAARSIIDPLGEFLVRVPPGDYDLIATASGWAASPPTPATAGNSDIRLALSVGAILRGTVVASADQSPVAYARVMRESRSGGASVQPFNAGTVTRSDGTFELTGIPPGPLSITVGAGGYHPKIEAGMTATDGAILGPLTIALDKLADGERPKTELVGIGIQFRADGEALRVDRIIPGGGAEAAGIVAGDQVVAIDGLPVAPIGVDGAVAKIRGVAGTTITVTVRRGDKDVQLIVERRKIRV